MLFKNLLFKKFFYFKNLIAIWTSSTRASCSLGNQPITTSNGLNRLIQLSWNCYPDMSVPDTCPYLMSNWRFRRFLRQFYWVKRPLILFIFISMFICFVFICHRTMQNSEKAKKLTIAAANTSRAVAATGKVVGKY